MGDGLNLLIIDYTIPLDWICVCTWTVCLLNGWYCTIWKDLCSNHLVRNLQTNEVNVLCLIFTIALYGKIYFPFHVIQSCLESDGVKEAHINHIDKTSRRSECNTVNKFTYVEADDGCLTANLTGNIVLHVMLP